MKDSDQKVIAVFGASRRAEGSPLYAEAYEVGRLLAQAGYAVMSGGYGGSMGAVSRGAAEAGGRVIGITCAIFDPLLGNAWLTEEAKTPTLIARLEALMEGAHGYVALRGGIGTLSEVTLAWSLLQTRSMSGKPLVLLGREWQGVVDAFRAYTDLGHSIAALARIIATPAELPGALATPTPPTPPGPPPIG